MHTADIKMGDEIKNFKKIVCLLLHIYAWHDIIYEKLKKQLTYFHVKQRKTKQKQGVFYEKENIYRWKRRHNGA